MRPFISRGHDQLKLINQQLDKQFEMETQQMMTIFGSMTRASVPTARTSVPSETETANAAQPDTIAKIINLTELPQTTPAEVSDALKLLAEPESWSGNCDIKPLGNSIVVRNTSDIVDRCAEAVAEMIAKEQKRPAE